MVLLSNKGHTRWVIPKGHFESNDSSLAERAQIESWEEGGLRGTLRQHTALGNFSYSKGGKEYLVAVFLLEDCYLEDDWPEVKLRKRILVSPKMAAELVQEPELKNLLRNVAGV